MGRAAGSKGLPPVVLGGESTAGHLIAAGRRSDGQADPGVRSTVDAGLTRAPDAVTWGALPGGASPGEFLAGVRTAEALGFDSVWVGDHVLWHVFWPEPLSMLGAASAVTERVGLGSSVLLAALRRPAPLAKQTATLQWLAGGRFHLGVGAGGEFAGEFEACGVPLSRRGAALDQTLEALRALWTGAPVTLHNDVVQLDDAVLDVVPDPAIPIWVGGRSPGAQRRAARYGDAWMPFVVTPERFREGWAAVRAQAEAFDRDPDQLLPALQLWCQFDDDLTVALPTIASRIEQTYRTPFERFERYTVYGDAEMWTERLGQFAEAGVRHFNLVFAGGDRLSQLARISEEVVPAIARRLSGS